jgi:hypothetical protein
MIIDLIKGEQAYNYDDILATTFNDHDNPMLE